MGTEPSREPSTLAEADARFRYVLADPAARGRFREGMAIAEGIYRPLVVKYAPATLTEADVTAVIGALFGTGRTSYDVKAIADRLREVFPIVEDGGE